LRLFFFSQFRPLKVHPQSPKKSVPNSIMTPTLYPANPKNIPAGLTSLPSAYKLKASLAVLAILLFFVLYFSLVLTLAWLAYVAFTYPMETINKFTILLKIGAIAGSAMLFVFTLKFILKLKNYKPTNRIKLDKVKHPEIWNFVLQICKDTGAPKPKSIYVDPDVNAYVSFSNMWLSLIFPVRKELTIGLSLVDGLNLSEFKAVTAHEFGHFAQRSMKIGGYIVSANTIIHDMIFNRDKWDNLLERWRASDIRLSFAAWLITPVIWIIRQILFLFYSFLNIMHASLSREMEFNADKVAVSISGSDAIVSSLWKLDDAAGSWAKTVRNAYLASQKNIFVKNLYHHNGLDLQRNLPLQNQSFAALPQDNRGGKKYFSGSETSKVGMYASHPPNDLRENNAKVPYVSCEADDRSPWLLFSNKEQLQEEMTALVYKQSLDKTPGEFVSAAEFEKFIYSENEAAALLAEYYNTFDLRFLHIPTKEEIEKTSVQEGNPEEYLLKLKSELAELMKPVKEIEETMQKATQIAEGVTKEKTFSFKGVTFDKKTLQQGYNVLVAAREELFNKAFTAWDVSFCAFHLQLARRCGKENELTDLYNQHDALNKFYKYVVNTKGDIIQRLQTIQSRDEVTEMEVSGLAERINLKMADLNKEMNSFTLIKFMPLPNIASVNELKSAIITNGEFKTQSIRMFENGGFDKIMNQIETAIMHCQRIDQKSIGAILSFHASLHQQNNQAARG
jgi:Zn-dependent protease with chaperone function